MRLTSEFWISALVRRLQVEGGFAAVVRRGSTEAGAVFFVRRARTGELTLYGPAPQTEYDETRPSERHFTTLVETGSQDEVDQRLEREMRFDPDIWVVELEADEAVVANLIQLTTP